MLGYDIDIVKFLKSREFGVFMLIVLAIIMNPVLGMDLDPMLVQLLLGSTAFLLVSYGLEKGALEITNQVAWDDDIVWYKSKRYGMVVIAFVSAVANHFLEPDLAHYAIEAVIALFGMVGVFSLTLWDLGEVVNPKDGVGNLRG